MHTYVRKLLLTAINSSVYTHIYIPEYTYREIHIYSYIRVYEYMYVYVCEHVYTCGSPYSQPCTKCVCVCVCVRVCVCVSQPRTDAKTPHITINQCIYTNIYIECVPYPASIYIYVYMYIYIHTYTLHSNLKEPKALF